MAHGLILMLSGKLEQAEKEFELGLTFGSALADGYVFYTFFCLRQWKPQKALASAHRARELSPSILESLIRLEATALSFSGRKEKAFALVKRTVERRPSLLLWVGYANLSAAFTLRGEFETAMKKVLELQPDYYPEKYYRLTGLFDEEGVQEQAGHFRPEWWK